MPEGAGSSTVHIEPPATWFEDGNWNEADIPSRQWIAPGYLLRGAVTLVIGPGGVSKSSLMVAYAVALALGTELHGMRPKASARSILFNVEDDADEQRRRLSAVLTSVGKAPADIVGKVARVGPRRLGMLLDRHPETGALRHTAAWDDLENDIERFGPDVLFLDPLAELHADDENANVALREVVAEFRGLARKHQIAVVIIHHTRKGAAAPGDMDSGRGASSIASAARVVLTVSAMQEEDAKGFGLQPEARKNYFRVDGGKSNYHTLTDCEWFERHAYTLANGDLVAVPLPWTPPTDRLSLDTRMAIERDVAVGSAAGPWSEKLSSDARSIKHLLVQHGIVTAPGQRGVINDLHLAGFVSAEFRRGNRAIALGLRSPQGAPLNVDWADKAAGA